MNPDAFIILTGHGHMPTTSLQYCNHVYWESQCRPLNEHGYVIGMPAQFEFVSKAIEYAKAKGFTHCLKTRGDCLVGIQNVTNYCQRILDSEQKQLLITQQTGDDLMGDCFMYGEIGLMGEIWDKDNPVHDPDGLKNTAINFRAAVDDQTTEWLPLLREHCAFRDVDTLKFMCMRWNYYRLRDFDSMFSTKYNYAKYHWGKANGWHEFDKDRNMRSSASHFWSAKQFYAESQSPVPATP